MNLLLAELSWLSGVLSATETGAGTNPATSGAYRLLFFYLALAIGVSFLCSLVEAVLLSVPRSHVALLLKDGKRTGRWLSEMKQNIDRPLAAILTLNTIAHTFGAAGVGAQSLVIFGKEWVAVTSGIVTFLVLILSEIIPKTLGAVYAKKVAPLTTYLIRGMLLITWPLVVMLNAVSRLLGSSHSTVPTREEIAVVADMAEGAGVLKQQESDVIQNLLQLNQIKVQDVMTPRSVTFMLQKDCTVEDIVKRYNPIRFSRIPIYGDTPDHIAAVVLRYSILQAWHDGHTHTKLQDMATPLHAIPAVASVANALDQFISTHEHIFLAVDEFGGTAGIITLEDAVETLLGVEIVDESDSVHDMRQLAREAMERRRRAREAKQRAADQRSGTPPSPDGSS